MAKFSRLLPRNRFARSVSILAGGTAAGQAILVLATPLLTRLYTPEDFGVLAVFASLLGVLGVVASLRYQLAIPLPESDRDAADVTVLSLIAVLGTSAATAGLVLGWAEPIARLLNTPVLAGYLWLLPVGLFVTGVYQVFYYWAVRSRCFPAIARTKLVQSLIMVLVQAGAYTLGPIALLVGRVLGLGAGVITLGWLAVYPHREIFQKSSVQGIKKASVRHKFFPIYSTWAGAFNKAGLEFPPILFAVLFNPAAAGVYMLAHRVLVAPLTLIGKAVADVFFERAPEANRQGDLAPLVARLHFLLAQIAMPPVLVLIISGPRLFEIGFGSEWREAGIFARYLAPYLYFQFIISPLSNITSVLDRLAQGMSFQLILFVARVLAILIGARYGDLLGAVILFSLASALCWGGYLVWALRLSGNGWDTIIRPTAVSLGFSLLTVWPIALATINAYPGVIWGVALGLTCVLIIIRYYALKNTVAELG